MKDRPVKVQNFKRTKISLYPVESNKTQMNRIIPD